MTIIDPSKEVQENNAQLVPKGVYLLALVWCEPQQSRGARESWKWNLKYEVIDGECKGKAFFCDMWADDLSEGMIARWALWAKAARVTEPFDTDHSQSDVKRAFLHRGFKAQVEVDSGVHNGKKWERNVIKRFELNCSPQEREVIELYEATRAVTGSADTRVPRAAPPAYDDMDEPPYTDDDMPF